MINEFIQNTFYHYVLKNPALANKWEASYFDAPYMQSCFQHAKEFMLKYQQAPSAAQMKELVRFDDESVRVPDEYVDILYESYGTLNQYPEEWLHDNSIAFAELKHFMAVFNKTAVYVKMHYNEITVDNVKEITEYAKNMFSQSCILDLEDDDDTGTDFWDPTSHKQVLMKRSTTGYDYIDICMKGGTFPGSLTCFAGAPKSGKSLWLQNLCAESIRRGEDDAYISLELPTEMIHARIGSNMFNIPALDYEKYSEDTETFAEIMRKARSKLYVQPGYLYVKDFPTSTLSVPDLETHLLRREEKLSGKLGREFHFKNIYVDYINIMRNFRNPNSENTYMKIKQLAEDLKAMAKRNGWAVITATQTNRTQFDTDDVTVSQIAESAGLGATVDLMFGIISSVQMAANSEYYLKCLYDRVAPYANTKKRFNLDKVHLRISEDISGKILDCVEDARNRIISGVKRVVNNLDQYQQPSQQPQITVSDAYEGMRKTPVLFTNDEAQSGMMTPDTHSEHLSNPAPSLRDLAGITNKNIFFDNG